MTPTNNHVSTDIAKLWFFAVVIYKLVRFVIGRFDWLWRKYFLFLVLFYILITDEIYLKGKRMKITTEKDKIVAMSTKGLT